MNYEENPSSIKYYVKRYLIKNQNRFSGKKIIDFPAGNGVTTRIIKEIGAQPYPFDLFPEYFNVEGIKCKRVNIKNGIPLNDQYADVIICQEGIEHFSDQLSALKEFSRLLKIDGTLLITTPNYSSIRSKISYLLSESERFNSIMPPNELDSIWMSDQDITDEIYYGHIFLIGIQKLRVLSKLAGFRLKKFHFTKVKTTSLILLPFIYPFIYLSNRIAYRKNLRRNKNYSQEIKKEVYGEIFKLSINPKVLISGHLMVEFVKEKDNNEVANFLKSQHKEFGTT